MVIQKEKTFDGRVGPLLFYDRQGTRCVRMIPTKIVQNNATKKAAAVFCRASRLAKAVRKQLFPVIPFPKDGKMQTRLTNAIYQWLIAYNKSSEGSNLHLAEFNPFQFNESGFAFHECMKTDPEISIPSAGLLKIKWPAFIPGQTIFAPLHTKSVKLKLAAGCFDVKTGLEDGGDYQEIVFEYIRKKIAVETASFHFPMSKGRLVIVGASLEYMISNRQSQKLNRDKSFMPAAIIAAMYI